MTISIHSARRMDEEVPPGTWEGTKQDAVLATAQLLEVLSRKKSGEKIQFGISEYDSQMANAQLRAFKLTKVILRKARRNSSSGDVHIMIEDLGFHTPDQVSIRKPATPPPNEPLPTPPLIGPNRAKPSSPSGRKTKSHSPVRSATPVSVRSSGTPPPIPPRRSSNRNSQVLPAASPASLPTLTVPPPRVFSDEVSPRTTIAPTASSHAVSPRRQATSPLPLSPSPRRQASLPTVAENDDLPVQPFRRVRFGSDSSTDRSDSPLPESSPILSPHSTTTPLVPKRGPIHRSYSFRFGEGLQKTSLSRSSSVICSELSDALKDLQRTIGAVEVH